MTWIISGLILALWATLFALGSGGSVIHVLPVVAFVLISLRLMTHHELA